MNPFVRYAAGQLGIRDGACPRRWAVARKGGEEEPVMVGQEWWEGGGWREQVGTKVACREKIRALVRWRLLCRQSSFSGDGL